MKGVSLVIFLVVFASYVTAESLDVNIYKDLDDGKDYGSLRAKPGDTVNAFIEVENLNQDRTDDDQEVENIEVRMIIEDIDDGDDYEVDFNDFDLRPRRDNSLEFSYRVPKRVEEKSYTIRIEVEYTEAGQDESRIFDFFLDIDKEDHNPVYERLEFSPNSLRCGEITSLRVRLLNMGTDDEEDLTIDIENAEIGILISEEMDLEAYPDDDVFEETYQVRVPLSAESKTYPFLVTTTYAFEQLTDKDIINLEVTCERTSSPPASNDTEESEETTSVPSTDRGPSQGETPTSSSSTVSTDAAREITIEEDNSALYLLIFILIGIVLIIILSLLLLKKK